MILALARVAPLAASVLVVLALGLLARRRAAPRTPWLLVAGAGLAALGVVVAVPGVPLVSVLVAAGTGVAVGVAIVRRGGLGKLPGRLVLSDAAVGVAAVLVGLAGWLAPTEVPRGPAVGVGATLALIGAVSAGGAAAGGALVALGRLTGRLPRSAMVVATRRRAMLAMVVALLALALATLLLPLGVVSLTLAAGTAAALGGVLVAGVHPIDLALALRGVQALAGVAVAVAGVALGLDVLLVAGALTATTGVWLAQEASRATGRDLVRAWLGSDAPVADAPEPAPEAIDADGVARLCAAAHEVVVVPGHGVVAAGAGAVVARWADALAARGVRVRFAVHPLAGRLPGQVHATLLAAGVPASACLDADQVDFDEVDLCVVLGAHDLLHPALWGPRRSPLLTARARVLLQDPGRPGYAALPLPPGAAARTRRMTGDLVDGLGAVIGRLGAR